MTLEQISYLAEIIGVILVVASLLYVGQQLRQNTEMMRAESRNMIQHNHQQEILTPAHFPEIWRGFTGEELSDEGVRVNMWLGASIRSREHEWLQYQSGALDERAWAAFSMAIPLVLSSRRARAWWDATRPVYDPQFAQMVDELLEAENLHDVHIGQASALEKDV